jgi:hypothetical protein
LICDIVVCCVQVTSGVKAQLDSIQSLAVDNSGKVKKDINSMVSSFSNSTDNVRKNILDKIRNLKTKKKADVDKYNTMRYQV